MIKETITYEDFNGDKQTEDLYFNITKTELSDFLDRYEELKRMQARFEGLSRDLNMSEIKEMIGVVKMFVEASYGVRSEDGKRFRKSPEIWADFRDSAAYDEFLFSLFQNPDKIMPFLNGIMPKDLKEEAEKQIKAPEIEAPQPSNLTVVKDTKEEPPAPKEPKQDLSALDMDELKRLLDQKQKEKENEKS